MPSCKLLDKIYCEKCGCCCEDFVDLCEHIANVHKSLKFMCPLCKKDGSESTIYLQNHFTKHDRKAIVEKQELFIQKHVKENPSVFLYYCDKCGKGFNNLFFLQEHKNGHFLELFSCSHCPKTFGAYAGVMSHFKKFHIFETDVRISCQICKLQFGNTFQYRKHMRDQHNVTKAKLVFECSHCSFVGVRNVDFIKHLFLHVKRKYVECCSQVFKNRLELDKHKSTHKQAIEQNKKCNICKEFIPKIKFLQHVIWHKIQNQGSVRCSDCDKKFTDAEVYLEHKKTRTDCAKSLSSNEGTQSKSNTISVEQSTSEKPEQSKTSIQSDTQSVSKADSVSLEEKATRSSTDNSLNVSNKISETETVRSSAEKADVTQITTEPAVCKTTKTEPVSKITSGQPEISKQIRSNTTSNFCKFCDKHIETGFLRHVIEHKIKDEGSVKCTKCERSFTDLNLYLEHKKNGTDCVERKAVPTPKKRAGFRLAQIAKTVQTSRITGKVRYVCLSCSKQFKTEHGLSKHTVLKKCKSLRVNVCSSCTKKFKTEQGLSKHKRLNRCKALKVHEMTKREKKDARSFLCFACFRKFGTKEKLQNHLIRESKEPEMPTPTTKIENKRFIKITKPVSCSLCSHKFTGLWGLHKHTLEEPDCQLRSGTKKIMCTPCNRLFKNYFSLYQHNSSFHQGVNPIQLASQTPRPDIGEAEGLAKQAFRIKKKLLLNCNWCEQVFISPQALKQHSLIHTQFRRNVTVPSAVPQNTSTLQTVSTPQEHYDPSFKRTTYNPSNVFHASKEPYPEEVNPCEDTALNATKDYYERDTQFYQPKTGQNISKEPEESIAFQVARKRDMEMGRSALIKSKARESPTIVSSQNRREGSPARTFSTNMQGEPPRASFPKNRDRQSPHRPFPTAEKESFDRSQSRGIDRLSPRRSLSRGRHRGSSPRSFSRHADRESPRELLFRDNTDRSSPYRSLSRDRDRISPRRSRSRISNRESPHGSFTRRIRRSPQRSLSPYREIEISLSRSRNREVRERSFPRKSQEGPHRSFHKSRDRESRGQKNTDEMSHRNVSKSHETTDYDSRSKDLRSLHSTHGSRDIVRARSRGKRVRDEKSRSNSPYRSDRHKKRHEYQSSSSERKAAPEHTRYIESEMRDEEVLYKHARRHKCKECGEEFESEQSLAYHTKFHLVRAKIADAAPVKAVRQEPVHREQLREKPQAPKCKECGSEFLSEQSLLYHMKSHAVPSKRLDAGRNERAEYSQTQIYYLKDISSGQVRNEPANYVQSAGNYARDNSSSQVRDEPAKYSQPSASYVRKDASRQIRNEPAEYSRPPVFYDTDKAQARNESAVQFQTPAYYVRNEPSERSGYQVPVKNIKTRKAPRFAEDFPPIETADTEDYDDIITKELDQLLKHSPSVASGPPVQPHSFSKTTDQSRYKTSKEYELGAPRDTSYYFLDSNRSEKNKRPENRYFSQKATSSSEFPVAPPAPQISNTDKSKPFTSLCLETIKKVKHSESKPYYQIPSACETAYPNVGFYSKASTMKKPEPVAAPRQETKSSFVSNRVQCPGCGESIPKPLMLYHRCPGTFF